MSECVVIDKSFLQGEPAPVVRELARRHRLLMSGALFYELMTTSSAVRRRCFMKLPKTENPVVLVDHVGELLRYESKNRMPCKKPSMHSIEFSFRFNEKLNSDGYELPDDAKEALLEWRRDIEDGVYRLVDLVDTIPAGFPGLLCGSAAKQKRKYHEAERWIADLENIHDFYKRLGSISFECPCPVIFGAYEEWAFLRWLQVKLLFALDLYFRYRGRLREGMCSPKVCERLEHEIHDAEILAMGVLEGAIATKEEKLKKWWRLLCPEGVNYGDAA